MPCQSEERDYVVPARAVLGSSRRPCFFFFSARPVAEIPLKPLCGCAVCCCSNIGAFGLLAGCGQRQDSLELPLPQ